MLAGVCAVSVLLMRAVPMLCLVDGLQAWLGSCAGWYVVGQVLTVFRTGV